MPLSIAIIGDRFMQSRSFATALETVCPPDVVLRTLDLDFPDTPMQGGRQENGTERLREFIGDPEEVAAIIGDAEILITHLGPLSATMLERAPALKMVAVARGGPTNVDMDALRARNLRVVNTPGRNASAVAEFTIGAILIQSRNFARGHAGMLRGEWRGDLYRADRFGREISEMTVGLVGFSEIGRLVAGYLEAFGCRILVADPYVELTERDRNAGIEKVEINQLLEQSDVVSLHARLTPETKNMIDAAAIGRMKKGAILVNTARGQMVDHDALYAALKDGRLSGAALDTMVPEPPPADWPLLELDNVTLTPHIAGASGRTVTVTAGKIAEEVRRYLAGEPPLNAC